MGSADAKIPEVSSSIEEGQAKKAQIDKDLEQHKTDRVAAQQALADAASIREKEASMYAATKSTYGDNIAALEKATKAIETGMAGAFLQTGAAKVLRNMALSSEVMTNADRLDMMAFLAAGQDSEY